MTNNESSLARLYKRLRQEADVERTVGFLRSDEAPLESLDEERKKKESHRKGKAQIRKRTRALRREISKQEREEAELKRVEQQYRLIEREAKLKALRQLEQKAKEVNEKRVREEKKRWKWESGRFLGELNGNGPEILHRGNDINPQREVLYRESSIACFVDEISTGVYIQLGRPWSTGATIVDECEKKGFYKIRLDSGKILPCFNLINEIFQIDHRKVKVAPFLEHTSGTLCLDERYYQGQLYTEDVNFFSDCSSKSKNQMQTAHDLRNRELARYTSEKSFFDYTERQELIEREMRRVEDHRKVKMQQAIENLAQCEERLAILKENVTSNRKRKEKQSNDSRKLALATKSMFESRWR
mmetsp:Transcript_3053/g.3595  ORF Transcript_3053/g.3595 Transcript_3053/m.3595 type:complete len:357 (+) Transcript_3053:179-1249(+)